MDFSSVEGLREEDIIKLWDEYSFESQYLSWNLYRCKCLNNSLTTNGGRCVPPQGMDNCEISANQDMGGMLYAPVTAFAFCGQMCCKVCSARNITFDGTCGTFTSLDDSSKANYRTCYY